MAFISLGIKSVCIINAVKSMLAESGLSGLFMNSAKLVIAMKVR